MISKSKSGLFIATLIILVILFITIKLSGHKHSLGLLFINVLFIDIIAILTGLFLWWTKKIGTLIFVLFLSITIMSFSVFIIYHRSYDSYNETRSVLWGLNGEVKDTQTCINVSINDVCVTIINHSGKAIKKIILKHEKGSINIDPIDINSQASVTFRSPGENSYILTAILINGDTLVSNGSYVEGGYKSTETITSESISTRHDDIYQ